MKKRRHLAVLSILLSLVTPACSEQPDRELDKELRRDLTPYFSEGQKAPVTVNYDFLRKGPTITGIAYPKYYLWITVTDSAGRDTVTEGAARVAQIDSTIEVTHYFLRDGLKNNRSALDSVFPKAVVQAILKHL